MRESYEGDIAHSGIELDELLRQIKAIENAVESIDDRANIAPPPVVFNGKRISDIAMHSDQAKIVTRVGCLNYLIDREMPAGHRRKLANGFAVIDVSLDGLVRSSSEAIPSF